MTDRDFNQLLIFNRFIYVHVQISYNHFTDLSIEHFLK